MLLKVFAVYDKAAEAYMQPYFAQTTGLALRIFQNAVNDPNSVIGKHPQDFWLDVVAQFDDSKGEFTPIFPPHNLLTAKEAMDKDGDDAE